VDDALNKRFGAGQAPPPTLSSLSPFLGADARASWDPHAFIVIGRRWRPELNLIRDQIHLN